MAEHYPLILISGAPAQLPIGDTLIANITGSSSSGGGGGGGEGGGDALQSLPLSQFAPTTSAQLAGVITNETGTGNLVFSTNPVLTTPTLVSPALGTPASGILTNCTGTALGLTSGQTATNANLTGPITSVGNATTVSDPELAAIASLTSSANKLPYFTGSGTADLADITAAGRALIDDADAAAMRATLGVGTGSGDALTSNPLSQFAPTTSAQLAGVMSDETGTGALVFATSPSLVTPAIGVASATTVNKVTITPPASGSTLTIANGATLTASSSATVSGTNTGDQTNISGNAATVTTNANLTGPITSVGNATTIADAELAAIAGLTSSADTIPYFTGSGTAALTGLTAAGRALMDDADAAAQRATLGIGASVSSADPMIVSAFLGSIYG